MLAHVDMCTFARHLCCQTESRSEPERFSFMLCPAVRTATIYGEAARGRRTVWSLVFPCRDVGSSAHSTTSVILCLFRTSQVPLPEPTGVPPLPRLRVCLAWRGVAHSTRLRVRTVSEWHAPFSLVSVLVRAGSAGLSTSCCSLSFCEFGFPDESRGVSLSVGAIRERARSACYVVFARS